MALNLTRRKGETFFIGEDVVVTVLECGNGRVRLGIAAPRSVSVHRGEVHKEIVHKEIQRQKMEGGKKDA